MLKLQEINSYYGKSHILHNISMEVGERETVSILGRNGAGKTTLLKTIMGLDVSFSGSKLFFDEDITLLPAYKIFRKGVALVPENREIFPNLSVEENLRIGAFALRKKNGEDVDLIFEYFPLLKKLTKRRGGTLSGGEMQALAIARTLMAKPKLLLLDEPTEGLAPLIVKELTSVLAKIKKSGQAILIVEDSLKAVMEVASRHYILDEGRIVFSGSAEDLSSNPEIISQYLGV